MTPEIEALLERLRVGLRRNEHERIWLEPPEEIQEFQGRMWCEDKVWNDGVEFIRADLFEALTRELAVKDEALTKAAETFQRYAYLHRGKNTPEGHSKATANAELALEMFAALTPKASADEQANNPPETAVSRDATTNETSNGKDI